MSKYIMLLVLVACLTTTEASFFKSLGNKISTFTQKVTDNVFSARNTVLTTLTKPILSQCTNVKNMLGLTYSKMVGKEPSFDELTFEFICGNKSKTYNLTTAATEIMSDQFYNSNQKLYLFIHGWMTDSKGDSYKQIREALYAKGNVNILALDSSSYMKWLYLSQSTYVLFIGEKLAQVLVALNKDGLDSKDMHIIGHSLGAHISGFAGRTFRNLTGSNIGRISGMDPAGPCFADLDDFHRLDYTDADFVDVIHSNANFLGLHDAIGHVDFYPNGGHYQAGCFSPSCNHGRSVTFFAESILHPNSFAAVKCDSWDNFRDGKCDGGEIAYMGFPATPDHRGTFYLQCAGKSLYGYELNGAKYDGFW